MLSFQSTRSVAVRREHSRIQEDQSYPPIAKSGSLNHSILLAQARIRQAQSVV